MGKHSDTFALPTKSRRGGVQLEFVRLRDIAHDVLCLISPTNSMQREYRAILEISATNYTLTSEEEQELIVAGYRSFLKSLTFPIQILVRSQQLDLQPYVRSVLESSSTMQHGTWRELAHSHAQYVRELAARRTLLEHRFYLIIPSDLGSDKKPHTLAGLLPFGKKDTRKRAESLEKAQQQLDLRADVISQQLTSLGLQCRRLAGYEAASLCYSCLTPDRALRHPLPPLAFESVNQPTRVKQKMSITGTASSPRTVSQPHMAEQPGGHHTQEASPYPDLPHLADLLAPASIEVTRDAICFEGEYARALAVTCFPREVSPGWLAPLLLHDDIADIVFHLHPQESGTMLRQLLRRKTIYQSSRRVNLRQGRIDDPETQVAEQDVDGLISQLASGEERIFELGFYVIVRATDPHSLQERTERMLAVLGNLFLVARPTTYEHAPAFRSFLPEARDELRRTFTLDCSSLATAFPFISNSLFMPSGVLVGVTPYGEPVAIDEWSESLDNPHEFCGAITGAGKSYLYKIRIMRELLQQRKRGLQVVVIDPEKEYEDLCTALGGDFIRLAPGSEQHLNPFDLLPAGTNLASYIQDRSRGDRLADKVQALHALFDIMLADRGPGGVTTLTAREKGLLDRALYETYREKGITADPRTHGRQAPLLGNLYGVLRSNVCGKDEYGLADRLYRFVQGSLSGPFNAPTDVALQNHLVVFDIRDMSGELRPIGVFLITDFVWTQVLHTTRPRKLYIDEAWSLIEHPEGGRFLANLARRARKRYLALVTITQNPELFATDEWGSVVAANAATKVLKKQDRTSADLRRSRHILSVADVAALWHLPQASDLADLPLLERGRARTYLSPQELTTANGWRIGCSSHAGHILPVYLAAEMLHHNLLAVARTGKGKSTLFLHLAQAMLADVINPQGLFVMEPHLELIETLTGLIPPARQDDVILLDVADMAYPPGINPLDATLGRNRDKAVDNLITIFERIWINSWGPRTENVLEFALKTLADANQHIVQADLQHGPDRQYTLLDVVPLLRNTSFRHAVMEQVTDPVLLSWWQYYYEPMDVRFQMEVISSVLNKLSKFASSRTTRRILGQPRSTINFTEIIHFGKILLVSTASGIVGADVSALLGATLLGLFHVTLAEQAEVVRARRRQFLALIDEFQVYQGADFSTMLAGLRKYGGSFGLATQSLSYLDRLDPRLRSTVLSNVDHLFAFAMSGEDARMLHEFDGIAEDDITNLDDFTCYAKLSLGGRRLPVFSLVLDPPATGNFDLAQRIRMRSQQRYARPCDVVDAMIAQALKRSAPTTLFSKSKSTSSKDETEEEAQNGASVVHGEIRTAPPTTKSSRKKHRGSGKGAAEVRQGHPLSLPLVYEHVGEEGPEEHNGH